MPEMACLAGAIGQPSRQTTSNPCQSLPLDTRRLLFQMQATRAAAVWHLRQEFRFYGFDVSAYPDNVIGKSVLQAAKRYPASGQQLFCCAFDWLRNSLHL